MNSKSLFLDYLLSLGIYIFGVINGAISYRLFGIKGVLITCLIFGVIYTYIIILFYWSMNIKEDKHEN